MTSDTIQTTENGTVKRLPYAASRKREYLTADEIERIIEASKVNRNGDRDSLMISLCFNHALRVSELIDVRWSQFDFKSNTFHVSRIKGSEDSVHHLKPTEIRALRRLQSQQKSAEYVFVSEQKGPMTQRSFYKIVCQAGEKAQLSFPIHPHMLRHSKGFQLANRGTDTRAIQDYLGHKSIQNTVRYTKLAPNRLKGLEM